MNTPERVSIPHVQPRRVILLVFGIGFVACMLVFVPATVLPSERFTQPKELILYVFSLLTALLCAAKVRVFRFDYADAGVLVLLLLGLVSTLTEAQNPWLAWRATGLSIAGALIFWSTRSICGSGDRDWVVLAIVLGIGGLGLACVLEAYGLLPRLSLHGRAPGGTLGNRNNAAHLFVLAIPLQFWYAMRTRRFGLFCMVFIGVAVCSAALVLTRSRAAWIAETVVIALLILATLLAPRTSPVPKKRAGLFAAGLIVGAFLTVAVPDTLVWHTSKLDSLHRMFEVNEGSGRGRLIMSTNTIRRENT